MLFIPSHDHARKYWSIMKTRMKKEGAEPTRICSQLKIKAYDGKMRLSAMNNSVERQPHGLNQSAAVAKEGAKAAKVARQQIEKSTGKPAVSKLNAKNLGQIQLKDGGNDEVES
jgi:hypothetical protein